MLITFHFWITFMQNDQLHHIHTQTLWVFVSGFKSGCVCECVWMVRVWCVCSQANIKPSTRTPTAVGLLTFMLSNWFRVWFMKLSAPTCACLPLIVQAHTPMCTHTHTQSCVTHHCSTRPYCIECLHGLFCDTFIHISQKHMSGVCVCVRVGGWSSHIPCNTAGC